MYFINSKVAENLSEKNDHNTMMFAIQISRNRYRRLFSISGCTYTHIFRVLINL